MCQYFNFSDHSFAYTTFHPLIILEAWGLPQPKKFLKLTQNKLKLLFQKVVFKLKAPFKNTNEWPIMPTSFGRALNISIRQDIGMEGVLGSSSNGNSLLHRN